LIGGLQVYVLSVLATAVTPTRDVNNSRDVNNIKDPETFETPVADERQQQ
jgi:hypothetical protein